MQNSPWGTPDLVTKINPKAEKKEEKIREVVFSQGCSVPLDRENGIITNAPSCPESLQKKNGIMEKSFFKAIS